jgi:hypothetical protein
MLRPARFGRLVFERAALSKLGRRNWTTERKGTQNERPGFDRVIGLSAPCKIVTRKRENRYEEGSFRGAFSDLRNIIRPWG